MTPGEAIGWLLVIAAAVAILPELFTPRPVPGVIGLGLILGLFGAALICDHRQPQEGHDGHD